MERDLKSSNQSFLIVGAGPAGLILGICLRRLGHQVTIIDRASGPHRPVCGEYLSPEGVAYLTNLDLSQTLAGFEPIWGMELFSPGAKAVRARFPENRFGVSLHRQEFQLRLASLFLGQGGKLCFGEAIESIEEKGQKVTVKTNGSLREVDGVVGADGRSSQVAKLADLSLSSPRNARVAVHAYLRPRAPLPRYGQMHIFADGSYAGINPLHANEVNFSIVCDVKILKKFPSSRDLINHYIGQTPALSRWFAPLSQEEVKNTFPINCERKQIARGRVVLIGDASGFIDPLTGEGITTAIKTAALLANKISLAGSLPLAFAAYARSRREDFAQKEAINRALQAVILRPWACEIIAMALSASPRLRAIFIGVIGNIYRPAAALKKLFWNPGGINHGQDSERVQRLSETPPQPAGNRGSLTESLARPGGRAGSA